MVIGATAKSHNATVGHRMAQRSARLVLLSGVLLVCVISSCASPYLNPPSTPTKSDLAGVWRAKYLFGGTDTLVLRADGTFKQVFAQGEYRFETPWNEWFVEQFLDGRVRVWLRGARYYCRGTEIAERDGMNPFDPAKPFAFWDPIGEELVTMPGQLALNVQILPSGETVLLHMLMSVDEGFTSIWGGEAPGTF
ncbi:MAG: hypothetical protein ACPL7O_12925, partial [Armatimonadota bacterium]